MEWDSDEEGRVAKGTAKPASVSFKARRRAAAPAAAGGTTFAPRSLSGGRDRRAEGVVLISRGLTVDSQRKFVQQNADQADDLLAAWADDPESGEPERSSNDRERSVAMGVAGGSAESPCS